MIGHFKIPSFRARTLQLDRQLQGSPVAVVDHSRILDVSPEARSKGFEEGQLLETVSNPEQLEQITFDLPRLIAEHKKFLESIQSVTPMVENFKFGEVFVEVESKEHFSKIKKNLPHRPELPLRGTATPTGWLAKILTDRETGTRFDVIDEAGYSSALKSVKRNEIWGLGPDVTETMYEDQIDTLAEIYHMPSTERQRRFGRRSASLEYIFEGKDPRPLNPFSRPETISQSVNFEGEVTRETIINKLKSITRSLAENLESSRSLTHQLSLHCQPQNNPETVTQHTFTDPTDDSSTLEFTVDSLFGEIELNPPLKITVGADHLVANAKTYHQSVDKRHDDLTIL